jgi:hypothetical protein
LRTSGITACLVLALLLGGCAIKPSIAPKPETQGTTQQDPPPLWFLYVMRLGRWEATKYTVEGDCRKAARVPLSDGECLPAGVVWKQVWITRRWLDGTRRSRSRRIAWRSRTAFAQPDTWRCASKSTSQGGRETTAKAT